MNYSNNDVDFYVINSLDECILLRDQLLFGSCLHFSKPEYIILYLCCSGRGHNDYLHFIYYVEFLLSITAVFDEINNIYRNTGGCDAYENE